MNETAIELHGQFPVDAAADTIRDGLGSTGLHVHLVARPVLEWSADRRFRLTWASGMSLLDGALSPTDLVGMRVTEAFGPIDSTVTPVEAHARALDGEEVTLQIRWGPRILEALVRPRRNAKGEAIGTVAEAYDMTANERTSVRGETGPAAHRRPRRGRIHVAAVRRS